MGRFYHGWQNRLHARHGGGSGVSGTGSPGGRIRDPGQQDVRTGPGRVPGQPAGRPGLGGPDLPGRAAGVVRGGARFAAERPPASDPVCELDGQGVLVTEYVDDVPRQQRRDEIRRLGGFWTLGVMLGGLHTLPGSDGAPGAPGAIARPGGAWHHLAEGLPRDEIAAAARILDEAEECIPAGERKAYAALRAEVASLDGGDGLPHALTHPHLVLANVIPSPSRGMVMVDWTGSGQHPPVCATGHLVYA